jgi:paspaline synthase
MGFFALEEWRAANADYDADTPPYWHAKMVPDMFTTISGVAWSIAYILMTRQGYKDKTYAMPIYALCLNITWEFVFGFIYPPGFVNQFAFAQNMIVDIFLFHSIVKFGPNDWQHHPLIARNLKWIIAVGVAFCLWLQLAIPATFVPVIGRQVVFFTAFPMQMIISIGCVAMVLSRGHDAGQSMAIW